METLTIKTPADLLSFIGRTLGFWPRESLVCITLVDNHVGATLRVDLPKTGAELSYAHTVAEYLADDARAANVLFAVYTSLPAESGHTRPHSATIAALTGALAERGMSIRDGLLVGDDTVSQYDGDPVRGPSLPLTSTQSSKINAEFVYRGSTIAPTNRITLPASTKESLGKTASLERPPQRRRAFSRPPIFRFCPALTPTVKLYFGPETSPSPHDSKAEGNR